MEAGRRYGEKSATERRADRRARLLEAAVDAFGTTGYRSASIEQLCSAAGISTRNFYEEFSNREELLIALHDDLNARAFAAVGQALAETDPGDVDARVRNGMEAYFRVMTQDRRWARIALVESVGVSPAAEEARRLAIGRFAAMISLETSRLAAAGLLPERDHELTAAASVGAINGLINTWTADDTWESRFDDVVAEGARVLLAAWRYAG